MYKTAFWFLIFLTILSLIFQMFGYDFLDTIVIVLIIDLIALGAIIEIRKKRSEDDSVITSKISSLENISQNILKTVTENPIVNIIDERINKQKEDVDYLLDRMSRKTLDLEEKLNKFGASLADSVQKLNERVDEIESPEEETSDVGEIVYMDSEE